jgi:uncharacterized LabA/DUF88 family protein
VCLKIYTDKEKGFIKGGYWIILSFRRYLEDKFRVKKAFLFIGYIPKYKGLYASLEKYGFKLVFKPIVIHGRNRYKGNIDAELVLHSCNIEYDKYDKAVIVSGDGDFFCLHSFLAKKNKLAKIIIPNSKSESSTFESLQNTRYILNTRRESLN